jgi:glutamate synthase domain-containing protein 3
MRKIKLFAGCTIDTAYNELQTQCQKEHNGETVGCSFNGHELTSDMSLGECYHAVTGKSKEEFEAEIKHRAEEYKRQIEEHKAKIPQLIEEYKEKAKGLVREDMWEKFVKILPIRLDDIYQGFEVQSMLDINKVLIENKDNEEQAIRKAKEVFVEQGHSGWSAGLTAFLVSAYSPVFGKEFFKKVNKR